MTWIMSYLLRLPRYLFDMLREAGAAQCVYGYIWLDLKHSRRRIGYSRH